jgi:hypothetical protein
MGLADFSGNNRPGQPRFRAGHFVDRDQGRRDSLEDGVARCRGSERVAEAGPVPALRESP